MAKEKAPEYDENQILALLLSIEHLSGALLPDKYYGVVDYAMSKGVIIARMVDPSCIESIRRTIPEEVPFVLVATGMGFTRFTVAAVLTDEGRGLLREKLAVNAA